MRRLRAIGLVSGGLDSYLAARLMRSLGIDVVLFHVRVPVFKPSWSVLELREALDLPLKIVDVDSSYLKVLHEPKHGYGRGVNPCIDCKAFFLRMARDYMYTVLADLVFTGEVLGQRPKSQKDLLTLQVVEREARLVDRLLRPLSAKLLPPTFYERVGLISRDRLLDISGRSRKRQFALLEGDRFDAFSSPAGGCLFTEKEFAKRFMSLRRLKGAPLDWDDMVVIKSGRFIEKVFEGIKVILIVPRNRLEVRVLDEIRDRLGWGGYVEARGMTLGLLFLERPLELDSRHGFEGFVRDSLKKYWRKLWGELERDIRVYFRW